MPGTPKDHEVKSEASPAGEENSKLMSLLELYYAQKSDPSKTEALKDIRNSILELIKKSGKEEINHINKNHESALSLTIRYGLMEFREALLSKKVQIRSIDLVYAARKANVELFQQLTQLTTDKSKAVDDHSRYLFNAPSESGNYPLIEMIYLLMAKGKETFRKNYLGIIAFMMNESHADLTIKDSNNHGVLHDIGISGNLEFLKELVRTGLLIQIQQFKPGGLFFTHTKSLISQDEEREKKKPKNTKLKAKKTVTKIEESEDTILDEFLKQLTDNPDQWIEKYLSYISTRVLLPENRLFIGDLDSIGYSILTFAAKEEHLEMVEYIIENCRDFLKDIEIYKALYIATKFNKDNSHAKIINYLTALTLNPIQTRPVKLSVQQLTNDYISAARSGDITAIDTIHDLFNRGILNFALFPQDTFLLAIEAAIGEGRYAIAKRLMVNLNPRLIRTQTLIIASQEGALNITKLLINKINWSGSRILANLEPFIKEIGSYHNFKIAELLIKKMEKANDGSFAKFLNQMIDSFKKPEESVLFKIIENISEDEGSRNFYDLAEYLITKLHNINPKATDEFLGTVKKMLSGEGQKAAVKLIKLIADDEKEGDQKSEISDPENSALKDEFPEGSDGTLPESFFTQIKSRKDLARDEEESKGLESMKTEFPSKKHQNMYFADVDLMNKELREAKQVSPGTDLVTKYKQTARYKELQKEQTDLALADQISEEENYRLNYLRYFFRMLVAEREAPLKKPESTDEDSKESKSLKALAEYYTTYLVGDEEIQLAADKDLIEESNRLERAIKEGDEATALEIIKNGSIEMLSHVSFGIYKHDAVSIWTALNHAISLGQTKIAIAMIEKGVSIDKPKGYDNPFSYAAANGNKEVLSALIKAMKKIESKSEKPDYTKYFAPNQHEETPLMIAVRYKQWPVVKMLGDYCQDELTSGKIISHVKNSLDEIVAGEAFESFDAIKEVIIQSPTIINAIKDKNLFKLLSIIIRNDDLRTFNAIKGLILGRVIQTDIDAIQKKQSDKKTGDTDTYSILEGTTLLRTITHDSDSEVAGHIRKELLKNDQYYTNHPKVMSGALEFCIGTGKWNIAQEMLANQNQSVGIIVNGSNILGTIVGYSATPEEEKLRLLFFKAAIRKFGDIIYNDYQKSSSLSGKRSTTSLFNEATEALDYPILICLIENGLNVLDLAKKYSKNESLGFLKQLSSTAEGFNKLIIKKILTKDYISGLIEKIKSFKPPIVDDLPLAVNYLEVLDHAYDNTCVLSRFLKQAQDKDAAQVINSSFKYLSSGNIFFKKDSQGLLPIQVAIKRAVKEGGEFIDIVAKIVLKMQQQDKEFDFSPYIPKSLPQSFEKEINKKIQALIGEDSKKPAENTKHVRLKIAADLEIDEDDEKESGPPAGEFHRLMQEAEKPEAEKMKEKRKEKSKPLSTIDESDEIDEDEEKESGPPAGEFHRLMQEAEKPKGKSKPLSTIDEEDEDKKKDDDNDKPKTKLSSTVSSTLAPLPRGKNKGGI